MIIQRGGKTLRRGYTTGLCAAAATRGALSCLMGEEADLGKAWTAAEAEVGLPILDSARGEDWAEAAIVKDAGDDPDVTDGITIRVRVRLLPGGEMVFRAGSGVGTVTKAGLIVPPGEPAINPGPRRLIMRAVRDLLPPGAGLEVTVSAPGGEEVAKRTLNSRLGIIGGISILGTTGIVEPMSEEAFKDSLSPQLDQAVAAGFSVVVLTPGRMGEKAAAAAGLPLGSIVIMSNFVGHLLEEAARREGITGVILFGHHGKLVKVAAGIFQTHSRVADARLETVAAEAARLGASRELVERILACDLAEGVVEMLEEADLKEVFAALAAKASRRAWGFLGGKIRVGTVLTVLNGDILAMDEDAAQMGRELGWHRSG